MKPFFTDKEVNYDKIILMEDDKTYQKMNKYSQKLCASKKNSVLLTFLEKKSLKPDAILNFNGNLKV